MPVFVEHIDAIARAKEAAALYLEFHPQDVDLWRDYTFDHDPMRAQVLAWLDAHGVAWRPCGPFADVQSLVPYLGQVYLDVPFDESVPGYCQLRDYLEHPDGSMRHAGVRFCVMPLAYAMRNVAHDEPGFWARWAEDF